jgi:hypothetical protein
VLDGGVSGQRHAPAALAPGNTRYPLYRRLGGPQVRPGRVRKISPPHRDSISGPPSPWQLLYRLSYPGTYLQTYKLIKIYDNTTRNNIRKKNRMWYRVLSHTLKKYHQQFRYLRIKKRRLFNLSYRFLHSRPSSGILLNHSISYSKVLRILNIIKTIFIYLLTSYLLTYTLTY